MSEKLTERFNVRLTRRDYKWIEVTAKKVFGRPNMGAEFIRELILVARNESKK